jgi:hypothetical protein
VLDGADSFVAGGHAVRGGGSTRHAERVANIPEWANSDAEVRALLLKVFPKLEIDENQRKHAAIWTLIIYYYYRMGLTQNRIALKTGWTLRKVHCLIGRIQHAVTRPRGKRGRPRKNGEPLLAPNGTNGNDSHISL